MRKLRITCLVLAAAAVPVSAGAQAPTPEQVARVCEVTPAPTAEDYVLNASTGITSGFLKHRKSDRVRLIIRDKNPFLYEYKVTVAETAVPEADLGAFLRLFGGPTVNLLPSAAAPTAPAAAVPPAAGLPGTPAGAPDTCLTKYNLVVAQDRVVASERDRVDEELAKQKADYDKLAAVVKSAENAFKSNTVCVDLFKHAVVVRNAIAAYDPKLDAFGERIAVLAAAISLQDAYLRDFPADCAQNSQVVQYREINRAFHVALDKARAALKELTSEKTRFDALKEKIDPIVASSTSFTEVRFIGDYDVPTTVKVTAERKERVEKATFQTLAADTHRFGGGARFVIAGGWSWATLKKPQFEPVQGYPVDRAGKLLTPEVLGPTVGFKERSDSRQSPLAMLHSRLWPEVNVWKHIFLSVGITAKNDNRGTDAEFLIGPSVAFAEDRAFFTIGVYGGRLQELQNQIYFGGPIPKELATIPVEKNLHWKLGGAITWRIR